MYTHRATGGTAAPVTLITLMSMLASDAQAGTTVGFGVGGLLDIPANTTKDVSCSGSFVFLDVQGVQPSDMDACDGGMRVGGQVVVPVRLHLSELAAVRITPGFQALHYGGTVSWQGEDGGERVYTGHTAAVLRPQLAVGGEFAFLPTGITPYVGAGVTVGANIDVHSLGPDSNGNHAETMEAYELRDKTANGHCNGDRGDCAWDAMAMSFGLGAEIMLGVRTADPGSPGFFAEASYNLLGLPARTPKFYPESVSIGPSKLNSAGVTAGVIIPL